jgi:DHA2 family multidrug resistance protein-like MFS transporter
MLCICGIGFALFNSPNQKNILSRVPQHLSPDASGLLSLARIAGQTLGTIMMSVWFFIFSINMLSELFILLALCFTFAAVLSYIRIRGDRNIFQP